MWSYIGLTAYISLKTLSNVGYRNNAKMPYQCSTKINSKV